MTPLYDLLAEAAVWTTLAPFELARGNGASLAVRLGRVEVPPPSGPRVLLHAVSAGEMAAAVPLAERLANRGIRFVVTTGNEAGRAVASRLPSVDAVTLLPWDRPRGMGRFLAAVAPAAVVVVENEIWPGLFTACRERAIPLVLVSARLYRRDVPRYRLARRFFREVLSDAVIGAQDDAERDAFLSIGADPSRTVVTGNLKHDVREPGEPPALGDGPFVVAGSTHRGEEAPLLAALPALRRTAPGLRLILAPRHPDRVPALVREVERAGLVPALLSAPEGRAWDVLLVDGIGALASLYRLATVAFIGGSLVPRGGQNPLEAAFCGVPIVVGPHVENVATLLDGLPRVDVPDAAALIAALERLLRDPVERARLGSAARDAVRLRHGAAERTAELVLSRMAP